VKSGKMAVKRQREFAPLFNEFLAASGARTTLMPKHQQITWGSIISVLLPWQGNVLSQFGRTWVTK